MSNAPDDERTIAIAAAAVGLSLPPETLPGVIFDFDRLRAMAELLMKHPLSAADEALPILRYD